MDKVLFNVLEQFVILVLLTYVVGYIISLLNRGFYKATGAGRGICLATGLIGTPIHEISHAVLCLVFLHRIDEIKFFQLDDENGTLGYVNHSYNPRNLYQKLGNFFIGVAPIFVGSLVILLLIKWMLPTAFAVIESEVIGAMPSELSTDIFSNLLTAGLNVIKTVFTTDFSVKTVILLLLIFCISLHMNLSGADIKGSLSSIPLIVILLAIVNFALYFITKDGYYAYLSTFSSLSCYYVAILTLSAFFSVILLIVGLILGIFTRR